MFKIENHPVNINLFLAHAWVTDHVERKVSVTIEDENGDFLNIMELIPSKKDGSFVTLLTKLPSIEILEPYTQMEIRFETDGKELHRFPVLFL